MKIKHIFSLAVLAVMTAACSSEDITQQPASQSGQTLPFKATISNSAGTRGLTAPSTENPDITATWVVDEQIALIHGATIDVVKVESVEDATSATPGVATLSGDITNYVENEKVYLVYVGCQPGAMDDFKTALVQTFDAEKSADATITAITEDMIKANFDLFHQDGTLTTINNGNDYRLGTSTLTKTNGWVTLSDSPKLNSQFAIWKLTLKNASGAALAATQLDVIGVEAVASVSIDATTAAADPEEVYVMLPAGTADYRFDATVGTEVGTYSVTHSGVSLTAGKFYQSTLTMTKTVNLARLEAAYEAQDGDILTGTLDATQKYKLSIADNATITLMDVTIVGGDDFDCQWAGINCVGSATIILKGTNSVKGCFYGYPGIHVPENKTLTIKGTDSDKLTAIGDDNGAGIGSGSGYYSGFPVSCGNIVINGGDITATGGNNSAGIGCGGKSDCGDITINGGIVTATGKGNAAGIGSGDESSTCGKIIISDGTVTAEGGSLSAGIGSGPSSVCGDITISGGTITSAKGGLRAAGIGSGSGLSSNSICGDITISGGIITSAMGGDGGAGIGSGFGDSRCGKINISGGTIISTTGGSEAAGIGSGLSSSSICNGITISGGTITSAKGGDMAAGIGNCKSGICGKITITTEIIQVVATKGKDALNSIGIGTDGGTCGEIQFGSVQVFDGTSWSPSTMVAGNYGGLNLTISTTDTWTLTPVP